MGPLLLLTLFSLVHADYDCLCNYNVEKPVYPTQSENGVQPIGYMYEFDCKAVINSNAESHSWISISYEHQVGYVMTDDQTQIQLCAGEPHVEDKVTTKQPSTTTTTTTTTPRPTTTTTTPRPTTTTTTPRPTTTTTTPRPTTTTTTTPRPTTTTTPRPTTTTTTPRPTTTTTTPRPTTTTTTPRPTTTTTTPRPTTTTTTPRPTTTTTTPRPTTTTTTTPRPTTTTTTQKPTTPTPIITPSTKPTIVSTILPVATTGPYGTLGCPEAVLQGTRTDGGTVFIDKTEGKCFEIVPSKQTYPTAESFCQRNGGHLATITSLAQNQMLHHYVQSYGHPTWIGLSDRHIEELFEWSSGEPLNYTNWHPGRKDVSLQGIEDCVVIGPMTGTWEDMDCLRFYAYVCEYDAKIKGSLPPIQQTTVSTTYNTGGTLACPNAVLQATRTDGGTVFIDKTEGKCFEIVPSKQTYPTAESFCQRNGGHLATIKSLTQNQILYNYVQSYGQPTWIGLSDRNREEHFVWSSGDPVTYTNWHPGRKDVILHGMEDCVAMGPLTGTWEDLECTRFYAYICEYDATGHGSQVPIQHTTPPSYHFNTDGNTQICPPAVIQDANTHHGRVLGQYGQSCYEIIKNNKVTWNQGENKCSQNGGNLAYITSAKEQAFVQAFMKRHYPNHAVWIGLNDKNTEGSFEWTSGKQVTYTNWLPGHTDNFFSHRQEDCVVFVPYQNGIWDDIPCGSQNMFGDSLQTYAVLCQYIRNRCSKDVLQAANVDNGVTFIDNQKRKCFELIESHTPWNNAVNHCHQNGGRLASISNSRQNELLHKHISSRGQHKTWIGMNDEHRHGHFTWVSGNQFTYRNWTPHNNFSSGHCVLMEPDNGTWETGNCLNSYPYICEFALH